MATSGFAQRPSSDAHESRRARLIWNLGLLVLMALGATAVAVLGLGLVIPSDASPFFVVGVFLGLALLACLVVLLQANDSRPDVAGAWMIATRLTQAISFAGVLLFIPFPSIALRVVVGFVMAGGHRTLGQVLAFYGMGSWLFRTTDSLVGSAGAILRASVLMGLALGVIGSLAIVSFLAKATKFNPLAASALAPGTSAPIVPIDQSSHAPLAWLWLSIVAVIAVVNIVARVRDRRNDQEAFARLSRQSSLNATHSAPATPRDVHEHQAEVPVAAAAAAPPDRDGDADDPEELRQIRKAMSGGDIAAISFEVNAAGTSVFVEGLSDSGLRQQVRESLNDMRAALSGDEQVQVRVGRIYFGGADVAPFFKKSILVRRVRALDAELPTV